MKSFTTVFYLITALSSTSCYVLLAANIEDFRTLAKQFVPESMADEFLEMAKSAIEFGKNQNPNGEPDFRNKIPVQVSLPDSSETAVTVRPKQNKLRSKSLDRTTSKYELTLDDLVEKVKQRLQSEISLMAASKKKTKQEFNENPNKNPLPKYDPSNVEEPIHPYQQEKSQSKYGKQSSDYVEDKQTQYRGGDNAQQGKKVQQQTSDKRYVAEMFVAQPPKYMYDLGKPPALEPDDVAQLEVHKVPSNYRQVNNKENKKQVRKIIQTKRRITKTTEAYNLFEGIDMNHTNDSYEEYVIPKKDEDYVEPETLAPKYKNVQKNPYIQNQPQRKPLIQKQTSNQKNEKIFDEFNDEYETKTNVENRDETINYNKKKKRVYDNEKYFKPKQNLRENKNIPSAEPLTVNNPELQIQPYVEQLKAVNEAEPEYAEETEQPITEKLKGRSEVISFDDYETSISHYVTPVNVQHVERKKKKKNDKNNNKRATIIPKRDGYKMSSPNYLVQIPIVGEKYHFDEPIPERDREPEKLDPLKNTKAIINGKKILL